jgi:hypothetical protein
MAGELRRTDTQVLKLLIRHAQAMGCLNLSGSGNAPVKKAQIRTQFELCNKACPIKLGYSNFLKE